MLCFLIENGVKGFFCKKKNNKKLSIFYLLLDKISNIKTYLSLLIMKLFKSSLCLALNILFCNLYATHLLFVWHYCQVNPPTRRVIEWMVDTRPWTVVLETMDPPGQVPRRGDGQGDTQVDTVLRGSVFDLKDAVMGGASIRLNVLLDPLAGSFFTQVSLMFGLKDESRKLTYQDSFKIKIGIRYKKISHEKMSQQVTCWNSFQECL